MKEVLISSLLLLGALLSAHAQETVSYVPEPEPYVELNYPSFRFTARAGLGFRAGKIPSNLSADDKSYLKGLLRGYSFGADATWFFNREYGIGIKFNNLHTASRQENATMEIDGVMRTGLKEDKIDIWFLGPVFALRAALNSKSTAYVSIGLGYLGYNDEMTRIAPISVTGGTLGQAADLGYEYRLTEGLSLGAEFSIYRGVLTKLKGSANGRSEEYTLEKDERENLSNLNLQVCLRYSF